MRLSRVVVLLAISLIAALPPQAAAQQLTVSAAASLTEAFKEIGAQFEAARPGVAVRFNFAASGVLIQQIRQGAPVDVFASADQETVAQGVADQLLVARTQRNFAANAVVLIVPAEGGAAVKSLADLASPAVKRIAIGKTATVPVGRYTRQVLEAAQLWAPLASKFVQADSVRQVLDYVARGEAEAGFVYRTDAALLPGKVRVVLMAQGHQPVTYPVIMVKESRKEALARDFIAFLFTPSAQAVFERYGFINP